MMTNPSSHCNGDGHSGESSGGGADGVKLFGVKLTPTTTDDGTLVKTNASMVILSSDSSSAAADSAEESHTDDPGRGSGALHLRNRRNKGVPWREEEHRKFLTGLRMLGKGAWRGISRKYVPSKTPSQVASHAQKYFMRQSDASGKRKRFSLFDMGPHRETYSLLPRVSGMPFPDVGAENRARIMHNSSLDLSLKPAFEPFPFQLAPPTAYPPQDDGAGAAHQQILGPAPTVQELNKPECSALSLTPPGVPLV